MTSLTERCIAEVNELARGRTRYGGQAPYRDEILVAEIERLRGVVETHSWSDQPLPEDAQIAAAHPMETGRHDLYMEAMRLVGARRSKGALVEMVNWLLSRITTPS